MEKVNYIFERTEKKYFLNQQKYEQILNSLMPYVELDSHGVSTICNIYYDTDTFDLARYSIEKPVYKEKMRLRSYGIPKNKDAVFLEIKKKWAGVTYKRRIKLKLEDAIAYLEKGKKPLEDSQILNEIDYFINFYKPSAKIFLSYNRLAFYSREDKNLRITFDNKIIARDYDLSLKKGVYGNQIIEDDTYIMEIKANYAMPIWLTRILLDLELYPRGFSKYGSVYKGKLEVEEEKCLQLQA